MAPTEKPRYPELLSLAVHEFRTPASVVGGYLRMLQRDSESFTERQRKMIDEAEKSCARIVALISELSDVSKLDAGIITLNRQPLDMFALLGEVVKAIVETGQAPPGRKQASSEGTQFFRMHPDLLAVLERELASHQWDRDATAARLAPSA